MRTLEVTIDGMHCDGCVKRVDAALRKLPGATPEKVQVGRARVQIENTEPEMVIAALERLGFEARVVQESQ